MGKESGGRHGGRTAAAGIHKTSIGSCLRAPSDVAKYGWWTTGSATSESRAETSSSCVRLPHRVRLGQQPEHAQQQRQVPCVGGAGSDSAARRRPLRGPGTRQESWFVHDAVGLALLTVLDSLRPDERLAFVLHDVFAVQHGGPVRAPAEVVNPEVEFTVHTPGGRFVTIGATEVAGRARVAGGAAHGHAATGDGRPGVIAWNEDGAPLSLLVFTVAEGRITEITAVVDPAELALMDLPDPCDCPPATAAGPRCGPCRSRRDGQRSHLAGEECGGLGLP
ncbi:hypothetical protein PV721_05035 [Streptomyces sp. MB09-01]|uniref:hypothetical protein n=1 Tax=Streptomyces sp. MB09-01 TaxID=3028666 RepID=UPI0029A2A0EF|nr:hypothetical protein [Streptomyces sp. MB09-01]MDX3533738.1 hypothetical protein [Streptomyces sp. MB09-01]